MQGVAQRLQPLSKKRGRVLFLQFKGFGMVSSQTVYTSTNLGGEWTLMREIGNNSTFDAQFNRISMVGTSCGVWSYHWGGTA